MIGSYTKSIISHMKQATSRQHGRIFLITHIYSSYVPYSKISTVENRQGIVFQKKMDMPMKRPLQGNFSPYDGRSDGLYGSYIRRSLTLLNQDLFIKAK